MVARKHPSCVLTLGRLILSTTSGALRPKPDGDQNERSGARYRVVSTAERSAQFGQEDCCESCECTFEYYDEPDDRMFDINPDEVVVPAEEHEFLELP